MTLTVRGSREEMIAMFAAADCLFHEVLPLSLEEIFISETEVQGYDIKKNRTGLNGWKITEEEAGPFAVPGDGTLLRSAVSDGCTDWFTEQLCK